MNYCTFVQWVPGSDVVVAQTKDNMGIWYNIDAPERVTLLPIKGDIIDIAREEGKNFLHFLPNFWLKCEKMQFWKAILAKFFDYFL